MSKSTGQILGTIAGGIIGAFVPGSYIALGASIGGMVGGAIDPFKGLQVDGPRLGDRQVQISTYGAVLPQVFGMLFALFGNVFYVENNALKEVATTEGGGKGGGGTQTTTYSYFATFAVALCRGPVAGHLRIWIAGGLWYDESATDLATIQTNAERKRYFRFYNGTDTQMPDPRMEAMLGVGNCPAYRGTCYIFFEELPLAEYGNSLLGAQVKVEVYCNGVAGDGYVPAGEMFFPTGSATNWGIQIASSGDPYEMVVGQKATGGDPFTTYRHYNAVIQNSIASQSAINNLAAVYDSDELFGFTEPPFTSFWMGGVEYPWFATTPYGNQTSISKVQKKNGRYYAVMHSGAGYSYARGWTIISPGVSSSTISAHTPFENNNYISVCGDRLGAFNFTLSGIDGTARIRFYGDDFLEEQEEYVFYNVPDINYFKPPLAYNLFYSEAQAWNIGELVYVLADIPGAELGVYIFNLTLGTFETKPICDFSDLEFNGPHLFRVFDSGVIAIGGTNWGYSTGQYVNLFVPAPVQPAGVTLASVVSKLCDNSRLESADINVTSLASDIVRGYSVASAGSPRVAIEQLQAPWPFDIVPHEYGIKFVRRPTASVLSIPESDLGAVPSGSSPEVRLKEAREMDSQLPQRVSIRYADFDREYDIGEQYDEAQNIASVNQRIIDLNIVLTATEAARVAQQLRLRAAVERSSYSFVLPPKPDYLKIQPADVVTPVTSTASHEILLTRVQSLPDGRIECEGVRNAAAVYSPTAIGVSGTAIPKAIKSTGPSYGLVLDIPQVHDDQGVSGVLVAMRGYSGQGTWPGGAAVFTRDAETSWITGAGLSLGHESTMGICLTALPSAPTFGMVDAASSLKVLLHSGSLNSISRTQLLNNNNALAIGIAGRWEVVFVQNCVETAPGEYTLSNFLRGRFGTEWAASLHQKGDAVVLLDANKIAWGKLPTSDFDVSRPWRFVTCGRAVETSENSNFTYSGVNLECLSPVKARTYKASNGDLVSTWKRRTRFNGEWRNRVDIPLNEVAEKYDVVIYTNSTRSVVKRTYANLSTPSCTYSNADQVTDFGATMYQAYATVFQVSESRGRGYGTNFVFEGVELDPYWSSVSFASHCDGANGSSSLIDEKGHTLTAGVNLLSTGVSKFGVASISPTSDSSYPGWAFNTDAGMQFGNGNFTVDFWVYRTSGTYQTLVIGSFTGIGVDYDWFASVGPSGGLVFSFKNTSNSPVTISTASNLFPLNDWAHGAICRSGTSMFGFVNGELVATVSAGTNTARATSGAISYIGAANATYISRGGYIDDIRVTKGVARWTSTFTPPSNAFTNR